MKLYIMSAESATVYMAAVLAVSAQCFNSDPSHNLAVRAGIVFG